MSNQSLTPRHDNRPVPTSDSQAIKQGVITDLISAPLVSWGGAALSAITTALVTYFKGLSLPLAIMLGVGVAFVLTLAANMISLIIVRHRRPVLPLPAVQEPCPDKWLHEIADRQRIGIEYWVFVQKIGIGQHDLLRESPHLDFTFSIFNGSIFRLSFGEVIGSVSYAGRLLGGQPFFVANSAANVGLRQEATFTIRQPLHRDDAVFVLNGGGSFEFHDLKIGIKGGKEFGDVEAKNLNIREHYIPCNELLAAYPKLDMEIVEAKLSDCYQLSTGEAFNSIDDVWDAKAVGSLITVYVRFKNPHQKAVNIQGFKLDPHLPTALLAPAERGEIYESPFGRGTLAQPLKNLNSSPFYAEQGQPFEGWLQFNLLGVEPNTLVSAQPTIIAVDLSGEEHRRGIPKLHSR